MIKSINKSDMVLNICCDKCGNQIKIYPNEDCTCKICKKPLDLSICKNLDTNIQSETYYLYYLKAGIINKDEEMIKENMDNLSQCESNNTIYLYMKNKNILKNIDDKESLDFIVMYDIIQNDNYSREEKLKLIRKTKYKEEYLSFLKDQTQNEEIKEKLYIEKQEIESYDETFDVQKAIGLLFIINSILVSVLIAIVSKYIINSEVLFASEIIISLLPALLFTIGLSKIVKIKNKIISTLKNVLIMVLAFFIMSFAITIFLNDNLTDCINNYIYHLTHCFLEIFEAMQSNFEGV